MEIETKPKYVLVIIFFMGGLNLSKFISEGSHVKNTTAYKLQKVAKHPEFRWLNKINNTSLLDNITLVTAYFLLPPFPKGDISVIRRPEHYLEWMKAFSWIVNPLIIYLDNVEIYYILESMFKHSNNEKVKLILIKRDQLWTFQQQARIAEIFNQLGYPVQYPNTLVPAYSCVTHAKFELLKWSIEQNFYRTKYLMWIDIGYFRMEVQSPFGLSLPPDFDARKVVLSQVHEFENTLTLESIVRYNLNWVAGGAVLGRYDVLHGFCLKYLRFVKQALKLRIIGSEQQMIYAMYSNGLRRREEDIQTCGSGWFCLGHLAVATWLRTTINRTSTT